MKKKIRIFVYVLLFAISISIVWMFSVNAFIKYSTKKQIVTLDEAEGLSDIDCVLVLGCRVFSDGTPSGMLEDRLTVGVDLVKREVSNTILMSGDHGTENYDEVNAMRNFALEKGIPIERIFMDHAGFCTYDSLYRAKEVFGAKKVVVVTQEYHLYRALYIAKELGLEAFGVSSDLHTYYGQSSRNAREILARNKDFFACAFKIKPKYLGDQIDLKGDGRVTEG
ncbi:MAG: SanA protein [Ruminococcaceae bacterium]|nr:SanA protein [Oscillospiraceae bacterium]